MTGETMALRSLLEKSAYASFLREMIGFAADRLMEPEVGERTGAAHGERSPDRLVQRNGYRDSDSLTRVSAEIDDRVRDFLACPSGGDWHYIWLDAT